jgi:hypothetical protein
MAVAQHPLTEQQNHMLLEAFNQQRRIGLLSQWVELGYVVVEEVAKLNDYRIVCAGVVFREPKRKFPSEELIAKLGLAVNSGAVSDEERKYNRMLTRRMAEHTIDDLCRIKEDVYHQIAEATRQINLTTALPPYILESERIKDDEEPNG